MLKSTYYWPNFHFLAIFSSFFSYFCAFFAHTQNFNEMDGGEKINDDRNQQMNIGHKKHKHNKQIQTMLQLVTSYNNITMAKNVEF